jgi:hypothetical protein
MDSYVVHANIDHYLGLLNNHDVPPKTRTTVTKLLIEEENKLSHHLEHLDFAEDRAAKGRDRLNRLRNLRDSFVAGSTDRMQADRLLANFEATQRLLEGFRHKVRAKVNSCGI